ncbi:UbiA prenyltransferase family protein [Saltatorellus ferox]|uniref:UbiA prenyltransferase family protein n=1 Tax=Saltatorellus ferox TaxID=2528018 RepID=UPI003AF38CC4
MGSPEHATSGSALPSGTGLWDRVRPYVQIARIDHWFKNAFMLLGVLLAFFYRPDLFSAASGWKLLGAFLIACLVASSNYVLNELLDAPLDREHPTKKNRPAARGEVNPAAAILLWGALGAVGVSAAFTFNGPFGLSALALWVMGCIYNVPPIRSKEVAYIDVLSESVNNPIRLALGWFALVPDRLPPLSLVLAYWMVGAFFMATKRFAEYRSIGDQGRAARYRRSFSVYNEARLLASMVFYVTSCALFSGVFITRYKVELILCVPFAAGFFAKYMSLSLKDDSPVQNPEKLYRENGFFAYAIGITLLFIVLMFVEIPALYSWFGVEPSSFEPLWRIGS